MSALRTVTLRAVPAPGGAAPWLLQGVSPDAKLRRRLRRTRVARAGAQPAEAAAMSSKRGGTGLGVETFKSRPRLWATPELSNPGAQGAP